MMASAENQQLRTEYLLHNIVDSTCHVLGVSIKDNSGTRPNLICLTVSPAVKKGSLERVLFLFFLVLSKSSQEK
jgi:predicted transcriptional regulator of viral defense system